MDKIKGKGTNHNQHRHRQQFNGRVFFKSGIFIWQYKVGYLNDIELIIQTDSIFYRTV